jgi:splicing factor 3A subunit 2
MSSYEQRVQPWDKQYQYLLFAAEPCEIIAFKVPSREIDKVASKFFTHWDPDSKMFTLYFKQSLWTQQKVVQHHHPMAPNQLVALHQIAHLYHHNI